MSSKPQDQMAATARDSGEKSTPQLNTARWVMTGHYVPYPSSAFLEHSRQASYFILIICKQVNFVDCKISSINRKVDSISQFEVTLKNEWEIKKRNGMVLASLWREGYFYIQFCK